MNRFNTLRFLKNGLIEDKSKLVGYIYEHGIGVAKNLPKAKTLYSNCAEAGDINAMLRLAYLYLEGRGTNRDYDKSYRWFGLAADSGSLDGLDVRLHETKCFSSQ